MQSDPLSRDAWGISRSAGEYETFQSVHSRLQRVYRGGLSKVAGVQGASVPRWAQGHSIVGRK